MSTRLWNWDNVVPAVIKKVSAGVFLLFFSTGLWSEVKKPEDRSKVRFLAPFAAKASIEAADASLVHALFVGAYSTGKFEIWTSQNLSTKLNQEILKESLGGQMQTDEILRKIASKGTSGEISKLGNKLAIQVHFLSDKGGILKTKMILIDLPVSTRQLKALFESTVKYFENGIDFDETKYVSGTLSFEKYEDSVHTENKAGLHLMGKDQIDSLRASSILPAEGVWSYGPEKAFDGSNSTAWVNAKVEGAKGEWLEIRFKNKYKIARVGIVPGYDRVLNDIAGDRFFKNARVKEMKAELSGSPAKTLSCADSREWQWLEFNVPLESDRIRLTILDFYPGTRWQDVCVSEIQIFYVPN